MYVHILISTDDHTVIYMYLHWSLSVWPDWAVYCTLGNFSKLVASIILPKSPTFLGNFCKGVKIFHFSSGIIFGQLLKTFGGFLLVTLNSLWAKNTKKFKFKREYFCPSESMSQKAKIGNSTIDKYFSGLEGFDLNRGLFSLFRTDWCQHKL